MRRNPNREQCFFSLIWAVGGIYINPHLAFSSSLIVFFLQLFSVRSFLFPAFHRSLPPFFFSFFLMGSGPNEVESTMSVLEVEMTEEWFFPLQGFRLEPTKQGDRVTDPPVGWVGVYLESLWAGLRFPLHGFVNELLTEYQLVSAQLAPNAWRTVIGFLSLCLLHGIPTSVNVFRRLFVLKSNPRDGEWLYIALRAGRPLFHGAPSSIHDWKKKFFFLGSERSWGFDPRWGPTHLKSVNKVPRLSSREQGVLDAIRSLGGGILLNGLISEDALVNVGLSSARPHGRSSFKVFFFLFYYSF